MRTVKLGDVAQLEYGSAFEARLFNSDGRGVPVVRIRDVKRGFSETFFEGEFQDRYIVSDGDYLIGMDGEFNIAQWRGDTALLNQRVCRLTADGANLDARYMFWKLIPELKEIEARTSFATVKHLSAKVLNALELVLPELEEQRRIAAILDKADEIRAKRQQVLDHLDTLTQSIFHGMFGDRSDLMTVSLGSVAEIQGGLQVSARRSTLPEEVQYLRVANVFRNRLDLSEIKTLNATPQEIARTTLKKGDLLFVEGHGNIEELGRVGMIDFEPKVGLVHQNHLIRARVSSDSVAPTFLAHWFNTSIGRRHFQLFGNTTSGLNTISASVVRNAPVMVPSIDEQNRFLARIDRIEQMKAAIRPAKDEDASLSQALQSRAFRGDL